MAWEWLGSAMTAVVAIAGIAGTAYAANQSRRTQLEISKAHSVRELIIEKRRIYSNFLEALEDKREHEAKYDRLKEILERQKHESADVDLKITGMNLRLERGELTRADVDQIKSRHKVLSEATRELEEDVRSHRQELHLVRKRVNHQVSQIMIIGGLWLGTLALRTANKLSDGDDDAYDKARIELWTAMREDIRVDSP